MKKILSAVFLSVTSAILFSCSQESLPVSENVPVQDAGKEFVTGKMNIKLSEELADLVEADLAKAGAVTKASSAELESLYQSMGIVSIGKLFNDDGGNFAGRHRKAGLNRWYEMGIIDPEFVTTDGAIFNQKVANGSYPLILSGITTQRKLSRVLNTPGLISSLNSKNISSLVRLRSGLSRNSGLNPI